MARNRKAKEYASLATQTPGEPAEPTGPAVPPLQPWIEGDLKLRQLAQRIETDYLAFCEVAKTAMAEGWHQKFGYVDASAYFDERIGLSYRTVRRRLAILEAIQRLPEAEQSEARAVMVELGSHKAGALAPLLGQEQVDWRESAEFARRATEDAVQSMVSEKLGRPHRGLPASEHPGHRFFAYILNTVPPDERERTEWVFQELMKLAESHNPMAVFLVLVGLGEAELAAQGKVREP